MLFFIVFSIPAPQPGSVILLSFAVSRAGQLNSISTLRMQNIVRILKEFFNKIRFEASFIGTFVLFYCTIRAEDGQVHSFSPNETIIRIYFLTYYSFNQFMNISCQKR